MKNYVIIGNSTAAIGCVEGIRKVDTKTPITLIASEPHHTYGRPLISYLLYGKTDEEHMKYRPDSFYADNGVETKLGVTVTSIDPKKKTVTLDNGETVEYSKLLVATGSRPFVPPIPGLDSVPVQFPFMTLDDAHHLANAITPDTHVLVMGAGLIGLKCIEGIAHRAGKITCVDMADRILPSILDEESAAMVQAFIEKETGVQFVLGDSVASFDGNTATTASGKQLTFDLLVTAVGVRANTELVKEAGGVVVRGISTDNRSQTSLPHIYAAGDCAESFDITENVSRVLALLPNAYYQGETAGINMAGGDITFDNAIPMNSMGFFGYHMVTAGSYKGEKIILRDGESLKEFFVSDGVLKGYIILGDVRRAGIYTKLIRERVPLEQVDFDLLLEAPQLIAFAKADRKNMLGTLR